MNEQLAHHRPPRAPRHPQTHRHLGQERVDPYHWLREKDDPEVRAYLEAENAYAEAILADTDPLREELFTEITSRIDETDTSAPIPIDAYWYYTRTEAGKEYPIYCRRFGSLEAPEEVLFDQNVLAADYDFFDCIIFKISPDHRYAAYSLDTTGDERATLYVKDLAQDVLLPDMVSDVAGSLEWAADSGAFYYTTRDATQRPDTVRRHTLGTDSDTDALVWHEPDVAFYVSLEKSKDHEYIFITSASLRTTEQWYLRADAVAPEPVCLALRSKEREYYAEHRAGVFYLVSNHAGENFGLYTRPVDAPAAAWQEVITPRADVVLESCEVFAQYVCVFTMAEGITHIRVLADDHSVCYHIPQDEAVYAVHSLGHPGYHDNILRLHYSSPVTPSRIYDIDLATEERTLRKELVVHTYDPTQYVVERQYGTASDGTAIPLSIVRPRAVSLDGTAPCRLTGYGSYGVSEEVGFSHTDVSLLARGFVLVIAHVRGGGENGKRWYDAGRYLAKRTTFTDFIAAAEYLVAAGYTTPEQLIATGGSAGGLLVGAVANLRPDLFQAIVADVPFVDVINTMCDPSLPLTTLEYEEWGNPNDPVAYEYIRSYAPYENVTAQAYPHLLAWAGFNDTRVPYWEAAKWVARLREMRADDNLLLLKTDFGHGHLGASGRYQAWREVADHFAFMLHVLTVPRRDVRAGDGVSK